MQIETEGFGRFEYSNGTIYEGQWKIVGNNVKVKHGEGTLTHAGTTAHEKGNEEYRGTWVEDKMEGYGVYKYTSGAIYSGEWKDGKQNGKVFIDLCFSIKNKFKRVFMNFLMVAFTMENGKITECMERVASLTGKGTDGMVPLVYLITKKQFFNF